MSSILQTERVRYECACGDWYDLCRLFFCRHCSELRCHTCAWIEIDSTFCPHCLENLPAGEARLKRNRCGNCNQCPICTSPLIGRQVDEACYLQCNNCRWSTRDVSLPDQPSPANWPTQKCNLEAELNFVQDQMKQLAATEKAHKDQTKFKRRSNVNGSMFSDRFGLQAMYNKRKATMEKPPVVAPQHEASEADAFDESILDEEVDVGAVLTLDARIRQPLAVPCGGLPQRMPLRARKALRCKKCEFNLCKLEYSPSSVKYKIQFFARNVVPDIRMVREPLLAADGESHPVILLLSNYSPAKTDVVLIADNTDDSAECRTAVVELNIPNADATDDVLGGSGVQMSTAEGDPVMFRKGNTAGIRLDVAATDENKARRLRMIIKYRNDASVVAGSTTGSAEWKQHRVTIQLNK